MFSFQVRKSHNSLIGVCHSSSSQGKISGKNDLVCFLDNGFDDHKNEMRADKNFFVWTLIGPMQHNPANQLCIVNLLPEKQLIGSMNDLLDQ